MVYLRHNEHSFVICVQDKAKFLLLNQTNWVSLSKKLCRGCNGVRKIDARFVKIVAISPMEFSFLVNSQVISKWILNPDLHVPCFVKGRVYSSHRRGSINRLRILPYVPSQGGS